MPRKTSPLSIVTVADESETTPIAVEGNTFLDAVEEAQTASALQLIESTTAIQPDFVVTEDADGALSAHVPTAEELAADAERMQAIIAHEQSTPRSRAKAFDALDAIEAAKAETKRPRARKASSTTRAAARDARKAAASGATLTAEREAAKAAAAKKAPAAKAAPKRVMAEDAFGKYMVEQEIAGHRMTTVDVERQLGTNGKPEYLTALYRIDTLKGKTLGNVRFDHGSWFVVRDDDETKVPSIGKAIAALAGK